MYRIEKLAVRGTYFQSECVNTNELYFNCQHKLLLIQSSAQNGFEFEFETICVLSYTIPRETFKLFRLDLQDLIFISAKLFTVLFSKLEM